MPARRSVRCKGGHSSLLTSPPLATTPRGVLFARVTILSIIPSKMDNFVLIFWHSPLFYCTTIKNKSYFQQDTAQPLIWHISCCLANQFAPLFHSSL
jgi:hypothetical protein